MVSNLDFKKELYKKGLVKTESIGGTVTEDDFVNYFNWNSIYNSDDPKYDSVNLKQQNYHSLLLDAVESFEEIPYEDDIYGLHDRWSSFKEHITEVEINYTKQINNHLDMIKDGDLDQFGFWEDVEKGDSIVLINDNGNLILDKNYTDLDYKYQYTSGVLLEVTESDLESDKSNLNKKLYDNLNDYSLKNHSIGKEILNTEEQKKQAYMRQNDIER